MFGLCDLASTHRNTKSKLTEQCIYMLCLLSIQSDIHKLFDRLVLYQVDSYERNYKYYPLNI